ncbi:MAG: ubiquinol-cytochrome c reductase iron-sulfur subunit [Alphaproteobacteria bacterium]|nr:ubiquinol-cytochrome c reductase iron-sulfur subunit [Alphaproteobacteria bacterium]
MRFAAVAHSPSETVNRRDFIYIMSATVSAAGAAVAAWPLIDQMNPSAAAQALSSTEVDLSAIQPGQIVTVTWRKQPVFIRRRTEKEIAEAHEGDTASDLKDPQPDAQRVFKPEWLVLVGICTHLGCVPSSQVRGDYDGWFCPCHGSHYDTSGRIRKGPAPKNLAVPNYEFVSDTKIVIGEGKTPAETSKEHTA